MQKIYRTIIFILIILFVIVFIQEKSFAVHQLFDSVFVQDGCRIESARANGDIVRYYYNSDNKISRFEHDLHQDGNIDLVQYYYYNAQGDLERIEHEYEEGYREDHVSHFIYDSDGRLIRIEYHDNFGNMTEFELLYYDSNGLLTKTEVLDSKGSIYYDTEYFYYDDAGRLERQETDWDSNGSIDDITKYYYDSSGKVIKVEFPLYNEQLTLNWNCDNGWIPDDENREEDNGSPEDKNGNDEADFINDENGEEKADEGDSSSSSSGCFVNTLESGK